jgi:hypothetical protein
MGSSPSRRRSMSKPPNPREPRSEPEIIPPDHSERGTERVRVYVAKPSPVGLILLTLIIGFLAAAALVVLLGAFLFLLPLMVLVATGIIVAGLVRFYFRGP